MTEKLSAMPVPANIFTGSDNDKLRYITFTEYEVQKRLSCLHEEKSPGVDNMSCRLLKAICPEIIVPVTLLFNLSMSEGKVPLYWKLAKVTSTYKQGAQNYPQNYRPISLTCHLSTIMKNTVLGVITQHLNKFNLIRGSQHGFRRGRSCVTNLLAFLNKVTTCSDAKESVDIIFLDFARAFDKVPHERLM